MAINALFYALSFGKFNRYVIISRPKKFGTSYKLHMKYKPSQAIKNQLLIDRYELFKWRRISQ